MCDPASQPLGFELSVVDDRVCSQDVAAGCAESTLVIEGDRSGKRPVGAADVNVCTAVRDDDTSVDAAPGANRKTGGVRRENAVC